MYIAAPTDSPSFVGGAVYGDPGHFSSYMFMTPGLSRSATRFRSAHEYMHNIQRAYYGGGTMFTESTANWASEWALPDVDPQDAFFDTPFLPLDCSYGTFSPAGGAARNCGNGYWQWSFMWRLSQRFGVEVIDQLFDEVATDCPLGCTPATDRATLTDVIANNGETLAEMYAEYTRDVWAPARWNTGPLPTTAMQSIHNLWGEPVSANYTAATADTGTLGVVVDHLSTRYVDFKNVGSFLPTGPNDQLVVDVGRPAGQPAPFRALARYANGTATDTAANSTATPHVELPADPALLRQLVVPLTNSSTTDGHGFSFRLQYVRGTPTPPANDEKAGAATVARGVEATTNNVYAGGPGERHQGDRLRAHPGRHTRRLVPLHHRGLRDPHLLGAGERLQHRRQPVPRRHRGVRRVFEQRVVQRRAGRGHDVRRLRRPEVDRHRLRQRRAARRQRPAGEPADARHHRAGRRVDRRTRAARPSPGPPARARPTRAPSR